MMLYQNPSLKESCQICFNEPKKRDQNTPDILDGNPNSSFPSLGLAKASPCLDNALIVGQCMLGQLSNQRDLSITIYNPIPEIRGQLDSSWQKSELLLVWQLHGAGWGGGGFAYHEATLYNLSDTLSTLARTRGDSLSRLSTSLNSLANVVMDNRPVLDYLLAEQVRTYAVINKTCYTYINTPGQVLQFWKG